MTDATTTTTHRVRTGLRRRYAAERRFRLYGLAAVTLALLSLTILFATIVGSGWSALQQALVTLDIEITGNTNHQGMVKQALRRAFPEVRNRHDKRKLHGLVSSDAGFQLRDLVLAEPALIGRTVAVDLLASDDVDMVVKGHISRDGDASARRMSDKQLAWLKRLEDQDRVTRAFNWGFFTGGDSREPEIAGIWGAAVGSFLTMLVTLALAFPLGVAAALYLEEFAARNRWTQIIEVNINNLAAVPSIVFGLLGLAVFLGFFGMTRSAPLVGGMVLALMTLPTVIIASRAALASVPPSIREAALGIGASHMQTVFHHVLPLAMPGMLTGAIIGMARALGETAPLLMIGMVAFIVDIPQGLNDPATVLPVQVYLWADSPERAFMERTSAAIMVLLAFLVTMNALAVILRNKFEKHW